MVEINKKELVSKNIYLVKHFAFKYYIKGFNLNYSDLVSSAMSGLLEAIDSYNPQSGLKFSLTAINSIKFKILNEIKRTSSITEEDVLQVKKYTLDYLSYFREINSRDNKNYIDNLINVDESFKNKCLIIYTAYLRELLIESKNSISFNELLVFFHEGLKNLSDLEQKVMYMYYTEEFNYSQINSLLNLSESNIFFIHTLALAKLKEYLSNISD